MSFTRGKYRKILKFSMILGPGRVLYRERVFERTVRRDSLSFCTLALFAWGFAPSVSAQTCQVTQLRVHVKDSQESPIYDVQVRIQMGTAQALDRTTGTSGTADFD